MAPDFKEEKKLWKKGYKYVACLDEAGRGPLAGPVVAGAVMIFRKSDFPALTPGVFSSLRRGSGQAAPGVSGKSDFLNIRDSKKLSPKKREEFYKILIKHPNIKWGMGIVSEKVIDKINILEATKLAMVRAIRNLHGYSGCRTSPLILGDVRHPKIDYLILDGKMSLDLPICQKSIIKADEKVFSCAAASIIAKVTRDRIMRRYHKKYLHYGFDKHKGYPTKYHYQMINKYGPCQIHRKSFNI